MRRFPLFDPTSSARPTRRIPLSVALAILVATLLGSAGCADCLKRLGRRQSNTGDATPSTLCSLVLVVVYWSRMCLSGKMMGAAPKAASAAS